MKSILDEIVGNKKVELTARKQETPFERLEEMVGERVIYYDFESAISKKNPAGLNIIAEVKMASPSKGIFREDFEPVKIARAYQKGGADALSVLTDRKYFFGDVEHISLIKDSGVELPILRKDFIFDRYQVVEAAAYGADAVLLIVSILSKTGVEDFCEFCYSYKLQPVVEVFTEEELQDVLDSGCKVIQINNRDLGSFEVDLNITEKLAPSIPQDRIVISASGFSTREQILRMKKLGVDAVLVGESLIRADDIAKKLKELRGR